MNLKPLDDRIVVRPNEAETQTASGLVIPDTAKEKPQQGEVLAVGPGKRAESSGELIPTGISVGDVVLYSKYGGAEVAVDGEDLLVLNGRDVLAKNGRAPTITNDGVSIAKEIELSDPFENMGAYLVKEVATETDDIAGDGTTTATVLAQALVHEGMRNVAAGAGPMSLKRGIDKAVEAAVEALAAQAT